MAADDIAVIKQEPQTKHSKAYSSGSLPPDRSISLKKLIWALLAISLGTVVECELSEHACCCVVTSSLRKPRSPSQVAELLWAAVSHAQPV